MLGIVEKLKNRETIILKEPIVKKLLEGRIFAAARRKKKAEEKVIAVDSKVPVDVAVAIVAKTKWAKNLAEGLARTFVAPVYPPGTPEYEKIKKHIAEEVARRVLVG